MVSAPARQSPLRRLPRPATAAIAVLTMVLASLAAGVVGASAAPTTEYGLKGEWTDDASTPTTTGGLLGARWFYNVNDANPDPQNPDHENLTITFSTTNAVFTEMPESCVADGDPMSVISADGTELVCNFGARPLGTAEVALSGLKVTGPTGDLVTLDATIGEADNAVDADVPDREIQNPFKLDLKVNDGQPAVEMPGTWLTITFPWLISHAAGSPHGPDSVSYVFDMTNGHGAGFNTSGGCNALKSAQAGYPFSTADAPAARTADFPTCTLERINPNRFRLTISGLNYDGPFPTEDSAGNALPSEWNVIASGTYSIGYRYDSQTTNTAQFNTPTYTAVDGQTYTDDASNNTGLRWVAPGWYSSSWALGATQDPAFGSPYIDTWRAVEGSRVAARAGGRIPINDESRFIVCQVFDTRYVNFDYAQVGQYVTDENDVRSFEEVEDIRYWYFVGTGPSHVLNPEHANYNPNAFSCGDDRGGSWVSELPADPSTVKAVRAVVLPSVTSPTNFSLWTYMTLNENAEPGQDVWVWSSRYVNDEWVDPARSMNRNDAPDDSQKIWNARYPWAAGGRDILRVVGAYPILDKTAEPSLAGPGETVTYTLDYRLDSPYGEGTGDDVVIEDVLPAGLTYVSGSASIEPEVSGQTLTWNLDSFPFNTANAITFDAELSVETPAGSTVTNTATMSVNTMVSEASAATIIRESGYTSLRKTTAEQNVPHDDGTADGSWTVALTSKDAIPQTFTDVIDILPFNGDGRGTEFDGSYVLSGPIDAPYGTVYYTSANPAALVEDPADASNGSAGDVAGNTVGWSTTFDENATGIRVIGGRLLGSETHKFAVNITTSGASAADTYVNRAEARASHTELKMRTSAWLSIEAVPAMELKKYVQAEDGTWHDAQDSSDYPEFATSSDVTYRLVLANTGDVTLIDIALTDDRVDLDTLGIDGLEDGAIVASLAPEEEAVFEYTVTVTGTPGDEVINNACAATEGLEDSCDPAGVEMLPGAVSWEKVAAGTNERLAGSEWELQLLDADGDPAGDPIVIVDCSEKPCEGADTSPEPGILTVGDLANGEYLLTEIKAPAGYVLLLEPVVLEIDGITELNAPIENDQAPAVAIPFTGGTASDAFALAAIGLMVLSGVIYIGRRRKRADARSPLSTHTPPPPAPSGRRK